MEENTQEDKTIDNENIGLCKILIVDDSSFSRKLVTKALEEYGFNIVGEASSGKEASSILNQTDANVIISDVVMPDMNGIELAKKFNDGFSERYFIMLSSLSQEKVIIEAVTAGAVDFIQKPFKQEQLIQSVLKVADLIAANAS